MLHLKKLIYISLFIVLHFSLVFSQEYSIFDSSTIDPQEKIVSAALSPDGKKLVTGGLYLAIVWDVESGQPLLVFDGHIPYDGRIQSVDFSPDGKYIVSGGYSYITIMWNASTGEIVRKFEPVRDPYPLDPGGILEVIFSPMGDSILTGGTGKIQYWNTNNGELINEYLFGGDGKLQFFPDGKRVLAGESNKTQVFSLKEEKVLYEVQGINPTLTPDGKYFFNIGPDNVIQKWNSEEGTLVNVSSEINEITNNTKISPDGKYVFIWNTRYQPKKEQAKVISVETGQRAKTFEAIPAETDMAIKDIYYEMKKTVILSEGKLYLYDISDLTSNIPEAPMHK